MGYTETTGLILGRRNLFEEDQEVHLLTPDLGGVAVRAPHARRSQKTFCGRLEPPNRVNVRLYRAREGSRWTLSSVDIDEVFADLLREGSLRYRLWPLLGLYRDLYPEGKQPGDVLARLRTGLRLLEGGFRPALLVVNRLLVFTAESTGIGMPVDRCQECGQSTATAAGESWTLMPAQGLLCGTCAAAHTEEAEAVNRQQLALYRDLRDRPWKEVRKQSYDRQSLLRLESILYRLFHYHFEISLDVLQVRQKL